MADAAIFADLIADHERQRALMQKLALTNDGDGRRELFETLRKELQAHAAAEEESLYATMLAMPDLREDARHSVSEHKEVDDMLGELVKMEVSSSVWLPKFKEMRHRYMHHIDEEELEMFPKAAKALCGKEEARLARVFEARKPQELARAETEMPGDARE